MNQRYKFTEQDIEIISKARADNHNDRAEIRLFALQLRAEGMQAKEIAQTKMPDLNAASLEAATEMIKGTARSMGINVQG